MSRASPPRVLVLRCPDLLALVDAQDVSGSAGNVPDASPEAQEASRAFEPVVAIVEEFCPQVEVLRPGVCAIATRGPARYFGGEARAGREARRGCQP